MSKIIKFIGFNSDVKNESLRLTMYNYNKGVSFLNLTEGQEISISNAHYYSLPKKLFDDGILILVKDNDFNHIDNSIIEINRRLDNIESNKEENNHQASNITFNNSFTLLSSNNVQDVIVELDNKNKTQDYYINNIQNNQYKVKFNEHDLSPDYLMNKIDNVTLNVVANKIVAKTLDGLITTI
jgi:hypothetical protein